MGEYIKESWTTVLSYSAGFWVFLFFISYHRLLLGISELIIYMDEKHYI